MDNAEQFTNGAIAFGAISSDPQALRDTISGGPPVLEAGLRSLPVQRPFLADFAEFSRLLRPGVRDLRAALPVLNQAVSLGAKVLPRTVRMNEDLKDVLSNLNDLVSDPSTLISLQPPRRHLQPRAGRRPEDRPRTRRPATTGTTGSPT